MMKFLLCLCLFFTAAGKAQAASDTIWWSRQPLQWKDFKGNSDTAVYHKNYLANTAWKVTYFHRWNTRSGQVEMIAYAWFDGRHSWARPSQHSNTALLQHEQGHFDLAEILVRQFKQQVVLTRFKPASYADSLQAIFYRLLNDMNNSQLQYDEDTVFGDKPSEQRRWQAFITKALEQLAAYADRRVLSKE